MDNIMRELYYMTDEHWAKEMDTPACRRANYLLEQELDNLEKTCGLDARKTLDVLFLKCQDEMLFTAFRMGLRLGLQLHTL